MAMKCYGAFTAVCLFVAGQLAFAQKKPLDHSVYDSWKSIRGTSLSHDGKWILYIVAPQEGDSKVEIKSLASSTDYTFDRGSAVQFSNDSKTVVASIAPPLADVKKATKDKVPAADVPKSSLLMLNLATGKRIEIEKVISFQLPSDDSGWLIYRPEPPKPAGAVTPVSGQSTGSNTAAVAPRSGRRAAGGATAPSPTGNPLVIRNLNTDKEQRIEDVGEVVISKDGKIVCYTVVSKDGKADGVYWLDLTKGVTKSVFKGKAKTPKIALNDETKRLAFLTDGPQAPTAAGPEKPQQTGSNSTPKKSTYSVYVYDPKTDKTQLVVNDGSQGIPKGWIVSENGPVSFSENGKRVFFGSAPKPVEEKKDDTADADKVSVDIWNWQDDRIMPQQILQATSEQRRTYQAMVVLETGKIMQLESIAMPSVTVSQKGDGAFALGTSNVPYRLEASWDEGYNDYILLDLKTGSAHRLFSKTQGSLSFSPDAKYLAGYDPNLNQYFVIDPESRKRTDFKIPTTLFNELEDTPSTPSPYGEAGWSKNDGALLVYDRYDIWSLDPKSKAPPVNMTRGVGRQNGLRFRYVKTDPEARSIDLGRPLLLSAFNTDTKAAGFYSLDMVANRPVPVKVLMEDKSFSMPLEAKNGNVICYTRQDFAEFPDVWVANPDFSNARKLSNANPQQAQFNWGTAEQVNWISGDGQRLQGILIRPENFSYEKKYPMITYFYERLSDSLHTYHAPAPSASTVNLSYFASNGYVMFVPDIPYKTGYPGESSLSAIVSGVLSIVNRGYIDPSKLGIQGQSWGGYEVAYLVTQTNLFHCACSGAAVADMFSAYGGIRYGTGILREGQYEHGQSRIGGSIWDKPLRYLENSPLFWLDKVQTPLLMMHNDKDGAVPFTQGIELFSGLRRLHKPAWMVSYNGEDHNLVERKNRKDWSVRLSQYFDHFLKGAPMPVWMSKGVPATMKGKTFGFELDESSPLPY